MLVTNFPSEFHDKFQSVISHEVWVFGIGAFLREQVHELIIGPDSDTKLNFTVSKLLQLQNFPVAQW